MSAANLTTGMASDQHITEGGQMSLAHPDLVPGDQVRYPHRRGWRFGVLVGFDGRDAIIAARDGATRQRVPAAMVSPWPPR